MSVSGCVIDKSNRGIIEQKAATRIINSYLKAVSSTANAGVVLSQQVIAQRIIGAQNYIAKQGRLQALLQLQKKSFFNDLIRNADPEQAFFSVRSHYLQVENRAMSIAGQAKAKLGGSWLELKTAFRAGKITEKELFAEWHNPGSSKNPLAKEIAANWKNSSDFLLKTYEQLGGMIQKRLDWFAPQSHDKLKLLQAGKDKWVSFVEPLLDKARMLDHDTGLPMSPSDLHHMLENIYDNLAYDQAFAKAPGSQGRAGKVANVMDKERVLIFDGDNWLKYNEKFGKGTVIDAMDSYIKKMSDNIAKMETFGPNVEYMSRFIADTLKQVESNPNVKAKTEFDIKYYNDMLTGKVAGTIEDNMLNASVKTLKNVASSAYLGSSVIPSVLADVFVTNAMTSMFNKGKFSVYLKNWFDVIRGQKDAKEIAYRLGYAAEGYLKNLRDSIRNDLGYDIPSKYKMVEISGKLAEATQKLSGLEAHTNASIAASNMMISDMVGRHVGTDFASLPQQVKAFLSRYNISDHEWNSLHSVPTLDHKGMKFFDVNAAIESLKNAGLNDYVAHKVQVAILSEAKYGTLTTSMRTSRAMMGVQKNLGVFAPQFLSFPLELLHKWGNRFAFENTSSTWGSKAGLIAYYVVMSTAVGVIYEQAKSLMRGEDIQPFDSPDLYAKGMITGGGLSIVGDWLFKAIGARNEKDSENILRQIMSGPATGLIAGTVQPALEAGKGLFHSITGNDKEAGKDYHNAISDLFKNLRQNTPVLSSLFYVKTIYRKMMLNFLNSAMDENYEANISKQIHKRRKESGTTYFWDDKSLLPEHMPGFSEGSPK